MNASPYISYAGSVEPLWNHNQQMKPSGDAGRSNEATVELSVGHGDSAARHETV